MDHKLFKKDVHWGEWLIQKALLLAGISSILIIALIFIFLFREAVRFFHTGTPMDLIGKWVYDDWEERNVFTMMWQSISEVPKYSLIPLICGSFLVAFPATLISAVLGIGCAVYLSEIAPYKVRETLKPALELLAGIPSVVIGFVMLAFIATFVQDLFHTKFRLNAFVGSLGVSLAVLPIMITISEDAMRAVPKELRDASYALGASKWQTIFGTVLPAAVSGISAAVILGFGRALGETMIVLMATGNAALVTGNIFSSVRTMTANIAAELGSVAQGSEHYYALFLVGAVLFTFTFVLNLFSEIVLSKMRQKLRM
ncbi:MAG TPA: phosphate ABC transporter permease subunit PstC [Candidatus Omnitrophota bacterium]|nr:phosphate ABC transporter permease subunit PstC [Candidatus Omnitrophota bacterium]HRY85337.1 phosphate ABC transporter permease subunit PstC [Candidatus Omnitrophota bacterium]